MKNIKSNKTDRLMSNAKTRPRDSSRNTYTAITKQEDNWWIGWIEEVPGVNCQELTREELLKTLKATLREAIDLNKSEALSAAESDYYEEPLQA